MSDTKAKETKFKNKIPVKSIKYFLTPDYKLEQL